MIHADVSLFKKGDHLEIPARIRDGQTSKGERIEGRNSMNSQGKASLYPGIKVTKD